MTQADVFKMRGAVISMGQHASMDVFFRTDEAQQVIQKRHDERGPVDWNSRPQVVVPAGVSKVQGMRLLLDAVMAYVKNEEQAFNKPQAKDDPGQGWCDVHGLIMEEMIKWTSVTFSDVPAHDRITRLEETIREFAHMGQAGSHLQATAAVVQEFFSDLSEDLKHILFDSMSQGVHTGVTRPHVTGAAKATRTATDNAAAVKKQLRKFMACSFVRAIPPTCRTICTTWGLEMAGWLAGWQPIVYSKTVARLFKAAWCLLRIATPYPVLRRLMRWPWAPRRS